MTSFNTAWEIVKNEHNKDHRDSRFGMGMDDSMRVGQEKIPQMAKELFLGTILAFLEVGQEDYVRANLESEGFYNVPESLIEQGRRMAITEVMRMM